MKIFILFPVSPQNISPIIPSDPEELSLHLTHNIFFNKITQTKRCGFWCLPFFRLMLTLFKEFNNSKYFNNWLTHEKSSLNVQPKPKNICKNGFSLLLNPDSWFNRRQIKKKNFQFLSVSMSEAGSLNWQVTGPYSLFSMKRVNYKYFKHKIAKQFYLAELCIYSNQ